MSSWSCCSLLLEGRRCQKCCSCVCCVCCVCLNRTVVKRGELLENLQLPKFKKMLENKKERKEKKREEQPSCCHYQYEKQPKEELCLFSLKILV